MSIIKSYMYNLVAQVFNVIIPIITIPYVAGILGSSDRLGQYAHIPLLVI
ncbi:hypothetical protein Desaci_4279 [Desulfosporosinus acidiphilus SJ4]|uniref:Uncharacterized protein n=1 Tax=Desulfosporosinus acidiphilus (strain DSM 22704 / JCM 16185 / SJ4) TaxID=646529 RepID=I4DBF6_DESAJ|nr:hypothetical protein Desaci_4279 [Desulfosporosinus acidiphilus SJ4]